MINKPKYYKIWDFGSSQSSSAYGTASLDNVKQCFIDAGFELYDIEDRSFKFNFANAVIKVGFYDNNKYYYSDCLFFWINDTMYKVEQSINSTIANHNISSNRGLSLFKGTRGIVIFVHSDNNGYPIAFDLVTNRIYLYGGYNFGQESSYIHGIDIAEDGTTTDNKYKKNVQSYINYTDNIELNYITMFGEVNHNGPIIYYPPICGAMLTKQSLITIDGKQYVTLLSSNSSYVDTSSTSRHGSFIFRLE